MKRAARPIFLQDSKTGVADRQQLRSAIGAEAFFVHARQSDRSPVFLLRAFRNQVSRPHSDQALSDTSRRSRAANSSGSGLPFLLPDHILLLRRGDVNSPVVHIGLRHTADDILSPTEY